MIKTHLEADDGGMLLMKGKVEYAPYSLRRAYVPSVDVRFDLVQFIVNCCSIWSFVNIFETVLHRFERSDAFDVDMTVKLQ